MYIVRNSNKYLISEKFCSNDASSNGNNIAKFYLNLPKQTIVTVIFVR